MWILPQFLSRPGKRFGLFILLAVVWYFFAPMQLGGRIGYVIVNGNSMEPAYHRGDLVIIAEASEYTQGDVVTYWDDQIKAHVIHRIIGSEGDRFVLKGDNNDWVDITKPRSTEIIGKQKLFLPDVGNWIIWVRDPGNMFFILFFLGAGAVLTVVMQPEPKITQKKKNPPITTGIFEYGLYSISALALLFVVATVYSFTRPSSIPGPRVPYTVTGEFAYTASGSSNIYDSGVISTGSPIFFKLTCNMDLEYKYSVTANGIETMTGTQYMTAYLIDEHSGWRRTIPLTQERPFMGNSIVDKASLNLCGISDMIRSVETETGFRSTSYTLQIVANTTSNGIITGLPFMDSGDQSLEFTFDNTHIYLSDQKIESNPIISIKEKLINNPNVVENSIKLGEASIPVKFARIFSITGLVIFLMCIYFMSNYFDQLGKKQKANFIKLKFGHLIIDASISGLDRFSVVVDVKNIDELVKVANRNNSMIFHLLKDGVHYYLVEHEGTAYRYMFTDERQKPIEPPGKPPEPPGTILGRFI